MKPYSIAAQPADSEWFIDPAQSSPGAVALCYRPGRVGPPIIAALAADSDTAARLVSAASRVNDRAGDRVRLATAALRSQLADSAALIETLTARVKELESIVTMHERAASAIATVNNQCAPPALPRNAPARRSREVKPDYRTAAECWLEGETPKRAKRAERKKSKGPQSLVVLFADGAEIRTSTYLDGQQGRNEAAQFARASRQSAPTMEQHIHWKTKERVMVPTLRAEGQWVRDGKGCWRLVAIAPCPEVLSVEFVER